MFCTSVLILKTNKKQISIDHGINTKTVLTFQGNVYLNTRIWSESNRRVEETSVAQDTA